MFAVDYVPIIIKFSHQLETFRRNPMGNLTVSATLGLACEWEAPR